MATLHNCGVKVEFIIDNFDKQFIQEADIFYEELSQIQKSQIEIKECSKVYVKFESQNTDSFLEIQNIFDYNDNYIRINCGDTKKLFEGQNKYSMLVPGDHIIRVGIGNKLYYSTFTVIPRHINDMQLQNLRSFVNNQISGLSYDIETTSNKFDNFRQISLPDYINVYKCYEKEFPKIKSSIEEILRNPISVIEKKYVKGQNTKKDDSKTIRFSEKRDSNEKIEVKKYQSLISKENATAKYILSSMYHHLRNIDSKLVQFKKQLQIELSLRKREYDSKELILSSNKPSEFKSFESERKIKSLNQSLADLGDTIKRIDEVTSYIVKTRRMISTISKYNNTSFLKDINETHSITPSKNIFKDARYNKLYRCYEKVISLDTKSILNYKSSDILYEYFILLIIVKSFKDLGYILEDCDFKKLISARFVDKIPEGCNVVFTKEDIRVEIWYEKELFSIPSEVLKLGGGFYTHTNNKLPDIRVDIYNSGSFVKSCIIEVKYRRYSYLWNDYTNIDTMTQIKNYKTTVQYISKEIIRPIFPIEKVIVIYPGQQDIEVSVEKDWGSFLFLQVRPGKDENDIHGYKELMNILAYILRN
jgi:hypothetical protein